MRRYLTGICLLSFLLPVLQAGTPATSLKAQAQSLKQRGDARGALDAYRKAAEAEPQSAELQDEIGFLYAVLKQPAEAKEYFRRAVALQPGYAPAWYHLGVVLWHEQNADASIP